MRKKIEPLPGWKLTETIFYRKEGSLSLRAMRKYAYSQDWELLINNKSNGETYKSAVAAMIAGDAVLRKTQ